MLRLKIRSEFVCSVPICCEFPFHCVHSVPVTMLILRHVLEIILSLKLSEKKKKQNFALLSPNREKPFVKIEKECISNFSNTPCDNTLEFLLFFKNFFL